MKGGDKARLKTEKRDAPHVFVTLIARSHRYAGWHVWLPSGSQGIALDSELIEIPQES